MRRAPGERRALGGAMGRALGLVVGVLAACADEPGGAPDAGLPERGGRLLVLAEVPVGVRVPVLVASIDPTRSLAAELRGPGGVHPLGVYRGRGSASVVVARAGDVALEVTGDGLVARATLRATTRPERALAGPLQGAALVWDAGADVHLTADVQVAAGEVLRIGPGTRVLVDPRVSLEISGRVEAIGTAAAPILITAAGASAWGGLRVLAGASASLDETWLIAGGDDPGHVFGHSGSAPVVWIEAGELVMHGGGVLDSPGKAFGSRDARVELDGLLVARCDTGGELVESELVLTGSHLVELPDGDGRVDDDDNDGLYLAGVRVVAGSERPSRIADTVFARGEDDAIDHNGAVVDIERVWIEGFVHEGIAASTGGRVSVSDAVIRGCDQGIEAGYGSPQVFVVHSTITGCTTGLRFGDAYDMAVTGHLDVEATIATANQQNVLNHVVALGGPQPGAIEVRCSMVDSPDWDGLAGNLAGAAQLDAAGCLVAGAPGAASACDLGPRTCP